MQHGEPVLTSPADVAPIQVEGLPQSPGGTPIATTLEEAEPQLKVIAAVAVSEADVRFRQRATRIAVWGTWLLTAGFSVFLGYQSVWGPRSVAGAGSYRSCRGTMPPR